ncbi:MAG TPA: hypothetical protein VGO58_14255 [Chitinophagaceae bacterium]|jgi:hypothetical protein|nr:hypothetical protein [Chitinophagaceae bacterium]
MEKNLDILVSELKELDNELVPIDGALLKPSQCYHFETDPVHLLFNTNCPDSLKQKLQAILEKHLPPHESGTPE